MTKTAGPQNQNGLNRNGFSGSGSIVLGQTSKQKVDSDLDDYKFTASNLLRKSRKRYDLDDYRASQHASRFKEIEVRILVVICCLGMMIFGLLQYFRLHEVATRSKLSPPAFTKITQRENW